MAEVQLSGDLQPLVQRLSALMDMTPLDDPGYCVLKESYVAASDLLEKSQGQAIDDARPEYLEFSKAMKDAMHIFDEAERDIARISKVVTVVSQVVQIAGKVVGKLC